MSLKAQVGPCHSSKQKVPSSRARTGATAGVSNFFRPVGRRSELRQLLDGELVQKQLHDIDRPLLIGHISLVGGGPPPGRGGSRAGPPPAGRGRGRPGAVAPRYVVFLSLVLMYCISLSPLSSQISIIKTTGPPRPAIQSNALLCQFFSLRSSVCRKKEGQSPLLPDFLPGPRPFSRLGQRDVKKRQG